jgi:hypothetical protein
VKQRIILKKLLKFLKREVYMKQEFIGYPSTTQKASFTASSARITNAVGDYINVVRLIATQDCFVKIGQGSISATTSDTFLKASVAEYFRCHPGEKVAAIRLSADGDLYVTEMTQ